MGEGSTIGPEGPPEAKPATPSGQFEQALVAAVRRSYEGHGLPFRWQITRIPVLLLKDGSRAYFQADAKYLSDDPEGDFDVSFRVLRFQLKGGDQPVPDQKVVLIEEVNEPNQEPKKQVTVLGSTDSRGMCHVTWNADQIKKLDGKTIQVLSSDGKVLSERKIIPSLPPHLDPLL